MLVLGPQVLGIGSIVKNSINIGSNTIIGAGSVIILNCEKDSTYTVFLEKNLKEEKY